MYDNWAVQRGQLEQILELERALARQRHQQQGQRLAGQVKRLYAFLTHALSWRRWQRILPSFVTRQQA